MRVLEHPLTSLSRESGVAFQKPTSALERRLLVDLLSVALDSFFIRAHRVAIVALC